MIGDVLATSILFKSLRNKYPQAELHYIINSHTFPVIENNPFIDKIIFITPEIDNSKWGFYQFLRSIRKEKYEIVIDVYSKFSSNLITLFSNAKNKISYHKKYTSFIYNNNIKRLKHSENNASLAIENRLKLLKPLQIEFSNISPKIYLTNKEIQDSQEFLESYNIELDKPLYMISVLGSNENKTYPLEYIATLIDEIAKVEDSQIIFNYLPKQQLDAKKVYDFCKSKTQKHILFKVFGKDLRTFLAITHHCTALIGNEGGAINMAKALQIPTFTIFSPYLNKQNWFGESEAKKHVAVHLSDFINYNEKDISKANENRTAFYLKFKPEFIIPQLNLFLTNEL